MTTTNDSKNELVILKEKFKDMTQNDRVLLKSGAFINPIGDLICQIDMFNYSEREIIEGKDIILNLIDKLPDDNSITNILGEKEETREKISGLFTNLTENRNNIAASSNDDKRKKEYIQLLKGFRLIAEILESSNLPQDILASNLLSIKESSQHCAQNWKHTLISFMVIFRKEIAKKIGAKYNKIQGDELDALKMRYLELFYRAKFDVVNNLVYEFKIENNIYSSYDPHYKEICTNYLNKKYKLNLQQLENIPDNYIKNNDKIANNICDKFEKYLKGKLIFEDIYDRVCDYARDDTIVIKYLRDWLLYYLNNNNLKSIVNDNETLDDFIYENLLRGQCKNKIAYVAVREMLKSYNFIKIEKNSSKYFNKIAIKHTLLDMEINDYEKKRDMGHKLNKALQNNTLRVIEFISEYKEYDLFKFLDFSKIKDIGKFLTKLYKYNNIEIVRFLLESGVNVNTKDEYEETLLWYVLRNKNIELLNMLIKRGANLNIRNRYGDTPLWYVIKNDDIYLAKLLVKNGANINKLNKNKENILNYVIENRNKELVRYLVVNGANVNVLSRYGRTIFWYIAMYEDISMAKFLIKRGMNINLIDKYGETALWYAVGFRKIKLIKLLLNVGAHTDLVDENGITILSYAIRNNDTKAAKLLIKNGANVNKIDAKEGTALWYAVKKNNMEIIQLLLGYGANMEIRDGYGDTMLCYLVKSKNIKILQLFIEKGADINGIDKYGKTALWYAIRNELKEITKLLVSNGASITDEYKDKALWYVVRHKNSELIKTILDSSLNLDINELNKYGKTALWYAVKSKNFELINLLINKGARKMDNKGEDIFWYAIKNRNEKIVNSLVQNGIDINEKNTYGENALWYVVKSGNFKLTKLLIDNGIDINLKNRYGKTALWYAVNNQNKKIIQVLEQYNIVKKEKDTPDNERRVVPGINIGGIKLKSKNGLNLLKRNLTI